MFNYSGMFTQVPCDMFSALKQNPTANFVKSFGGVLRQLEKPKKEQGMTGP